MNRQNISEHARQIGESAYEFAKGSGGVARARRARDAWSGSSVAHDADIWKQMAELGWLGICAPEEQGGLGLGAGDMCVLLENVGKLLVPEPLVPAIAAAVLLADCAMDASDAATMAVHELISGERLYALATTTGDAAIPLHPMRLSYVPDCHAGARLLVCHGEGERTQLRMIETGAAGVNLRSAECVDGSALTEITINAEAWGKSALLADGAELHVALDKANDLMLLGYSAYLVGLMDAALQTTLSYMKMRTQFGTPIGAFQALQHRAASCHVDILACRALLYEACMTSCSVRRRLAASAVKARTSGAALRVTKECVQFHGAIGFADEHDIGLYLRKAMTFAARMGGEREQRGRFGRLASLVPSPKRKPGQGIIALG